MERSLWALMVSSASLMLSPSNNLLPLSSRSQLRATVSVLPWEAGAVPPGPFLVHVGRLLVFPMALDAGIPGEGIRRRIRRPDEAGCEDRPDEAVRRPGSHGVPSLDLRCFWIPLRSDAMRE